MTHGLGTSRGFHVLCACTCSSHFPGHWWQGFLPILQMGKLRPEGHSLLMDKKSWMWWNTPVILALRRPRQEEHCVFKANLNNI